MTHDIFSNHVRGTDNHCIPECLYVHVIQTVIFLVPIGRGFMLLTHLTKVAGQTHVRVCSLLRQLLYL